MSAAVAEIVVVGAGAIGCAVAWELAERGADVRVLDGGAAAGAATAAAGGMLAPLAEARQPGPFLDLALRSAELYPRFVDRLQDRTGMDVEYRGGGKLQLALDPAETASLESKQRWATELGHDVELLDGESARALEPAIAPATRAALLIRGEHRVDPVLLGAALRRAAEEAGARMRDDARVRAVRSVAGRVHAIDLASGERIEAGRVVIAAGCWSGSIAGLPRELPVFPVRGQMLELRGGPTLAHVVQSSGCYLIPRDDGRIVVGSTTEHVGYDTAPTDEGIERLRAAARAAVPELAHAQLERAWAGLRPGTPDELPILGADPEVEGLCYATGHYRNGILLAPATACALGALLLGDASPIDLTPFSVARFRSPAGDAEEPICERCGGVMFERHCKFLCPTCGYQRDCSDP